MISVKTNVASLIAQRQLSNTNMDLQKNIAKLSSGYRINTAADDAAGLAVSENMTTDIRALNQSARNANDGISMLQTAEGALGEAQGILQRMRELATQANSGGIDDTQRGLLDLEFKELIEELDDISADTQYNGQAILEGSFSTQFQVGIEATNLVTITLSAANPAADALSLNDDSITSTGAAATAIGDIDAAIDAISAQRATLGSQQNRLEVKISNIEVYRENIMAARSRIKDTDVAMEMGELTKNQILSQAGTSMLAQANSLPQTALGLLG